MNNKKYNHCDLFGDELFDDDIVIAAHGVRGQLIICKIIKQTNKMLRVEPISAGRRSASFLRYPKFLIKIDKSRAAEYIILLQD
jgi:hypothetical protein